MNATPFEGGRATQRKAVIVAAAGLALTLLLGLVSGVRALQAYHVAVVYWTGIAVGALLINMAFHAAHARWHVVLRRVMESVPLALPLLLVLFVPILLGLGHLFPWMHPEALEGEVRHLAEHRQAWLNAPFFVVRTLVYFGIFILVGHLLYGWSVRQDAEGGAALTRSQRKLAAGALPLVGLALTFAALDWQMSLDLHLASTIFGVYYFAGSFLAAFAVVILALAGARGGGMPGALLNDDHWHSLGKYLLAFVAFWAYIAFSQYLLIWIANLPEEVPWYLVRRRGLWLGMGAVLVVLHFVVPFFVLLSRSLKRNPRALRVMAIWILVIHYVDVYWVMMPAMRGDSVAPNLADLCAVLGVGAAGVAFVIARMRGKSAVPVGDPYLPESMRYHPS